MSETPSTSNHEPRTTNDEPERRTTNCERRTTMMRIRIAHSPDSDDAFMFYGLATGKVPSDGFDLEHVLSDIETLNRAACEATYEITAVSFHAYAHLTD